MRRFSYSAESNDGTLRSGTVDAEDRNGAIQALVSQRLQPIKLEEIGTIKSPNKKGFRLPSIFSRGLSTFDQIIIVRHLGIVLSTGTDILTGLDIIARDSIKKSVRDIMYDIRQRVARGEKLSDSFGVWKHEFNPILISLIRSGEISGSLPSILINYAQELRKDYAFIRKFRGAIFYPIILVGALVGMVVIVLSFVAPRLKELFLTPSFKGGPPVYIKFLFTVSDIWIAYTIPIIIVVIILIAVLIVLLSKREIRLKMASMLRFLPVISNIQKNITLMRFSRTISNLIQAGFSLKTALLTTAEVVDVRYKKIVLGIAENELEHGISLADAMKKYQNLFPDILISAVATGERSAKLPGVLGQMSEFYEENVIYSLETFLTLLEPALLIVVGIIIALMAGALISPIYQSIGRF